MECDVTSIPNDDHLRVRNILAPYVADGALAALAGGLEVTAGAVIAGPVDDEETA